MCSVLDPSTGGHSKSSRTYLFDFSPLVSTSATLGDVLQSCKKMESADNEKGRPIGWAAMCVHVDDCPGVSSSDLGRPKTDFCSPRVFASRGAYPSCGPRSMP